MEVKKIKHSSETFEFKTTVQQDGKTKTLHTHTHILFFRFSPNFPNVKSETVSITRQQMFAEQCEGQERFLLE